MRFSRRNFIKSLGAGAGACIAALSTTACSDDDSGPYTNAKPLWAPGQTRDKIVVISDIHLGIEDRYSEARHNRPLLVHFLQCLRNTTDVRELVIGGDFLDEWYLPVWYPAYTDQTAFYEAVVANNRDVFDELNDLIDHGIRVVYVPGNHDLTLEAEVLQRAVPRLIQARDDDAQGLGVYYTGDRDEIVVEHGHRYDVFSAPDTLTNEPLCGNKGNTILPAGYFYARYAATWVLEGKPVVAKNLPTISVAPPRSDVDQFGAYLYHEVLKGVSGRMTPTAAPEENIFYMRINGFNDAYSYLDFYPAQEADGTITAPVLFRHIQRTWDGRQAANNVKVPSTFIEAVSGAVNSDFYHRQAKAQYLEHPDEAVEVVVFGHTHVPMRVVENGKCYLNSGTWIDDNTENGPEKNTQFAGAERTFAVITTGPVTRAAVFSFVQEGDVRDLGNGRAG